MAERVRGGSDEAGARTASAASGAAPPALKIWHQTLDDCGRCYHIRAPDAQAFFSQHSQVRGAPWRLLKSEVKDTAKHPYLIVTPPAGLPTLPRAGPSKKRRPNDHKQLTPVGIAAASRTKRAAGSLGKTQDDILWKLVYGCKGDAQCDAVNPPQSGMGCSARLVCTATAREIARGDLIQIRLSGTHRADGIWTPPELSVDPIDQRKLSVALEEAQVLRISRGACEVEAMDAAGPGGAEDAARPAERAGEIAQISGKIIAKNTEVAGLRREMRIEYPAEVSDAILTFRTNTLRRSSRWLRS